MQEDASSQVQSIPLRFERSASRDPDLLFAHEEASPQVQLRFDQLAPSSTNLVFGADFVVPRNDLTVRAALPLPVAAIAFVPPARIELVATLPTLSVRSGVLRASVPIQIGTNKG